MLLSKGSSKQERQQHLKLAKEVKAFTEEELAENGDLVSTLNKQRSCS
jgi:hypothetical protein